MYPVMKSLNGLFVFISLLLSVLLVLMLTLSTFALSATAILEPENLAEMVSGLDMQAVTEDMIEDTQNGTEQEEKQILSSFLATDVAKDVVQAYIQSTLDVMTGKEGATGFTSEQLKQIVDKNMDQIIATLRQSGVDFAEKTEQEIADGIKTVVAERSEQILEALPDPQEVKQELAERNPELEKVLALVSAKEMIKLIWVGVIVALCLVIFLLRLYRWRGFKWLAVDLLLGSILSGGILFGMFTGAEQLKAMADSNPLLHSLFSTVMGSLNKGMLIRACIMLAAAIAFFAAYIAIEKRRKA